MDLENLHAEILETLNRHNEWLLIHSSGNAFSLKKDEIEFTIERERIIFGFLDEKGFQIWRVAGCVIEPNDLTLDLTRNFERERERIRLVPRASAAELGESVELARLEKANRIARLLVAGNPPSKLVRVALNEKGGRFARIIFEPKSANQIAALADVADCATPENLLTAAILWFVKLQNRKKNPIAAVWILAEKKIYKTLRKLHALLAKKWQPKIFIKEISRSQEANEALKIEIADAPAIAFENLWREKPPKTSKSETNRQSRIAGEIVKLAPGKIDVVYTKHGETLRFLGLPFARVRSMPNAEKAWFGIEREQLILNESTGEDFLRLLEELQNYRRFDSPNRRHAFFRLAPEAWLEVILARNIKLLDANLILSPIHNQFRAAADKIDLIALRSDHRLVVIELKVEPDPEMIFQAADYWRKIELQRRSGNLQKAKVFGDLEISDKPALVYLVAPTLSFHRDFALLAQTVSSEIEIYRFDLNENWRGNLKVMKVKKLKSEK